MQIYVDPTYPTHALDDVHSQLRMLTCLLSQGAKEGIDLDDDALDGMCAVLRACTGAVDEIRQMTMAAIGMGKGMGNLASAGG